MKKTSVIRRLGWHGGAVEVDRKRIMIRFPSNRLLRLVPRLVILAVAIIFYPWLLTTVLFRTGESVATNEISFFLELLRDLSSLGVVHLDFGRGGFLGDLNSQLPRLIENRVEPINEEGIVSDTLDLVFVAGDNFGFLLANRALKVGAIAVIVSIDSFRIPPNFRLVYIRRFSSTVMAIRKIVEAPETILNRWQTRRMGKRLLTVPEAKREVLKGLEDLVLEPLPKCGFKISEELVTSPIC
ncbi:hypothetical protein HPP92_015833 [Vanilla planifolia]|uniref:Uncharacterized protein n=1 Tax=Vanilla planifolia TaxID=51239 RepID=A0A835QLX8_VANPL|nr:hypothetical protein HPP92_027232 [Vanilla planifolia]KAG0471287.1 hypothetical protein HPP92_015833 [Vanilla planifolia]